MRGSDGAQLQANVPIEMLQEEPPKLIYTTALTTSEPMLPENNLPPVRYKAGNVTLRGHV